jgi:hypothetical protein
MVAEVTRYELLESLAHTLSDYRQGEIPPITPDHVEKWLNQFDPANQMIILSEMNSIMGRFYFPRIRIKEYLRGFLKQYLIAQQDPPNGFTSCTFPGYTTKWQQPENIIRTHR